MQRDCGGGGRAQAATARGKGGQQGWLLPWLRGRAAYAKAWLVSRPSCGGLILELDARIAPRQQDIGDQVADDEQHGGDERIAEHKVDILIHECINGDTAKA